MSMKDIAVEIFMTLAKNQELLTLIEFPSTLSSNNFMSKIKEQIIEDRYPSDLVTNKLTKICVYENPSSLSFNGFAEKCWVEVDIFTHRDIERINRKSLIIADHICSILDTNARAKRGLSSVAGIGLQYFNKIPSLMTDRPEWKKFGLVFNYEIIKI